MSTPIPVTKYRISGLDCAQCANQIEAALRKTDGLETAVVSFGTATVIIPAHGLEVAQQIIADIEPGARLIKPATAPTPNAPWHLGRIAVALTLTVGGLAFRDTLRATPNAVAYYAIFLAAYLLVGSTVLRRAARNIARGRVFDEMFLMSVATLGALAIGELAEAVAVMLFYSVGEYVQEAAVGRSRRSIAALMDLRPDSARVVSPTDASTTTAVAPEAVAVGAVIEVRPGERVPLDGQVVAGESLVNTAALTGESTPRSVSVGATVLAGFVIESATIRVRVGKPYAESSVARILELVEDAAARKAPTEKLISRLAAVYSPIVVGIAAAIAVLPPLILADTTFSEWVYRALVVLVISCPCALVISVPLGYFGGIGGASRRGILLKGAHYVDALTAVTTVVVDKTGTLTHGRFEVTATVPRNGFTTTEVLQLAAAAEAHSTHPIARSIRQAAAQAPTTAATGVPAPTTVQEEKGYGVTARVGSRTIIVGSDRLLHRLNVVHSDCNAEGTVVYVVVDGVYAGHIIIADQLKADARQAITELRAIGVKRVVMLTGDGEAVAARVAAAVGITQWHAGLLPEEKVAKVEELAAELPAGERLTFVGDGINDAPVLMRADVGVAMGALGSDAAIEAADVVLMDDSVVGIATAIRIARHTKAVVMQNVVLALALKALFLALGAVGVATMWGAVIADVGVTLLAVMNATRTLRYAGRE